MNGAVLRTLQAIDWDFAVPRAGYVAPPHWYPGTFVPALSDALIEALTPVGGTVFDPYGGIGTTGWSAMRTGRSCRVSDINPVALVVAYTTNALLALARRDRHLALVALGSVGRAIGRNDDLFGPNDATDSLRLDEALASLCASAPGDLLAAVVVRQPNWDALRCWIEAETLSELQMLVGRVLEAKSAFVRLLGLSMISATVRSISSQHASWGHIADNVRPRELEKQNVTSATARWLKRVKAFVEHPLAAPHDGLKPLVDVARRDWSAANPNGPGDADLLLTSPPYADAIDYTLAQRLSLYILGYDDAGILSLVAGEIGARRKRFKTVSRTQWSEQLCAALKDQVTWLKPGAAVCLVMPHKDSGRSAGENDMRATLRDLGWSLFFERDRSIHQSHTRQFWTSIKKETILVFTPAS